MISVYVSVYKYFLPDFRSAKPRNRPTFRQIQMHLEIAGPDLLTLESDDFLELQVRIFCILMNFLQ